MSTEITTTTNTQQTERFSAFSSPSAFEQAQRMAKLLTSSSIVPQTYRDNIADSVIALEMANRIGANPLAVMQNLYIVHGRPAWSSQFLISCINASGKFSPLRYKMEGDKGTDTWGCVAWAVDKSGERLEGPEVTIATAKAEGWFQKNGSKWKTMPELMLRYRAATLFARLYAPELTMGIQTDDEVIDISPVVTDPVLRAKPVKSDSAPQFTPLPARTPDPTDAPPGAEMPPAATTQSQTARNLKEIRGSLKLAGFTDLHLLNYLRAGGVDESLSSLDDIAEVKPAAIDLVQRTWKQTVLPALKAAAQPPTA